MKPPTILDLFLAELAQDSEARQALADELAPLITARQPAQPHVDGWIDTKAAAEYLGIQRNALHRLTAERRIPFAQNGPGTTCWFTRSELDARRRGHTRPAAAVGSNPGSDKPQQTAADPPPHPPANPHKH